MLRLRRTKKLVSANESSMTHGEREREREREIWNEWNGEEWRLKEREIYVER